ncbi:hypothetical protein GCM10022221_53570 [Actinocorallia aurea]
MEDQLKFRPAASGAGYLRNPVRLPGVTCAICATPSEGYDRCFRCARHRETEGTADLVAPLTYAVAGEQSGYVMRGYKAPSPVGAHYSVVAGLLRAGLHAHGSCPGRLVGHPVTHWASVPSLPAKPGEHPLHAIVRAAAPGREAALEAAEVGGEGARALSAAHFRVAGRLTGGAHVLLVDDTWVSGGHAQSAALALRAAGAGQVSIMVAARWIKPDRAHREFLDALPDHDPRRCPWTGGACPGEAVPAPRRAPEEAPPF